MQTKLKVTTVLFCGFVLLGGAGCGGSSGTARITDLEDKLEAEKEARAEAERQVQEAERKRQEEEAARREAESGEQDAETQRQEEEQRRQAAERERQRLADEAEKARQATNRAEARVARAGLAAAVADPAVVAGAVTARDPGVWVDHGSHRHANRRECRVSAGVAHLVSRRLVRHCALEHQARARRLFEHRSGNPCPAYPRVFGSLHGYRCRNGRYPDLGYHQQYRRSTNQIGVVSH